MNKEQSLELMKSSKSEKEWNDNCNKVMQAHSGTYPDWWYPEVIQTGLAQQMATTWGGDANIHIQLGVRS